MTSGQGSELLDYFKLRAEVGPNYTIETRITSNPNHGIWDQEIKTKWIQEKRLGSGGFGEVWLQKRVREQGDISGDGPDERALKHIPKQSMSSEKLKMLYQREILALAKFSSSQYREAQLFVQFMGWFDTSDKVFLAMEHVALGDLASHIDGTLTEEDARQIANILLRGLVMMHREGFTHRDIKPKNIFVKQRPPGSKSWWLKIGDFGISKRIRNADTSLQTQWFAPGYSAPEMYGYVEECEETSEYDSTVDIWSLGCTIFECLAAETPFPVLRELKKYCDRKMPFPESAITTKASAECIQFIKNLLEPSPDRRLSAEMALQSPWLHAQRNPPSSPPQISNLEHPVTNNTTQIRVSPNLTTKLPVITQLRISTARNGSPRQNAIVEHSEIEDIEAAVRFHAQPPLKGALPNVPAEPRVPWVLKHMIIVGVDFGIFHSAVSFVDSGGSSIGDINIISSWPGYPYTSWKLPSTIAYASENRNKIERNQWGFQVIPGLKSHTGMKLFLHGAPQESLIPNYTLPGVPDSSAFPSLPENDTAQNVCVDFLRELYQLTVEFLKKRVTEAVYGLTPLNFWFSTPAGWSVQKLEALSDAITAAGFGSRPCDSLNLIPEPEAAVMAALKPHLRQHDANPIRVCSGTSCGSKLTLLTEWQPGECIIVCDCEEIAVVVKAYAIVELLPILQLEQACSGMTGKYGSYFFFEPFDRWLVGNFGEAYRSKRKRLKATFMAEFERARRSFSISGDRKYYEIGPIRMDFPSSDIYDDDEGCVRLPRIAMKEILDSVVEDIIPMVSEQARRVKSKKDRTVDRIILHGCFGNSPYLNEKLEEWCRSNGGIQLIRPQDCELAVVKGAALRGLERVERSETKS